MPELKPCPFCGQIPTIEESARFPRYGKDEGERIKGYTVVCKNINCILLNADNWYRRSGKEACEAWNHRAEPENRPLTLDEIWEAVDDEDWNFVWLEYNLSSYTLQIIPHHRSKTYFYFLIPGVDEEGRKEPMVEINKEWRCWPRKPTPEQMAAEKWED